MINGNKKGRPTERKVLLLFCYVQTALLQRSPDIRPIFDQYLTQGTRLVYQTWSAVKGFLMKIISKCAQDHNLGGRPREQAAENV